MSTESKNLMKYQPYTTEEAEADRAALAPKRISRGAFEEGDNVIRILPALPGRRTFRVVREHYIAGQVDAPGHSFACPRAEKEAPCPLCAEARRLSRTGNPADKDAAGQLWPRTRSYCNAVNRMDEAKGVQVYGLPKTVHQALIELRENPRAGGDFADPEDGFDVTVKRTGKKLDTRYVVIPDRSLTPLHRDVAQVQQWLDARVDLETLVHAATAEEIVAYLRGDAPSAAPDDVKATPGIVDGVVVPDAADDDVSF